MDRIAFYIIQIKPHQVQLNIMAQVIDIPLEELPFWMRRARRGWDWGILLAAAFGLLAAWPFIAHPGLPRTNASENYVYLVEDYSDTLREGRLYPRWSPHVLSGYGAPIPHYFPPGAPYSAALVKVLFTNDAVRAVRVIFSSAFVIASVTLYMFVRRRSTAAAGLLAAILYIFNPYVGYTVPYIRGELAEFLALALLPVFLWSLDYLLSERRPKGLIFCTVSITALLLTHPQIALCGLLLALVLIVYHWSQGRQPAWRSAGISLLLGIGLAAFFWLPAASEQNLVRWVERPTDLHLTLTALFSPLKSLDLNELIPGPQFTLGTTSFLISLVAVIIILRGRLADGFHLLFLINAAALIALGLMIPEAVWLLGAAGLCLAVGSSVLTTLQAATPPRWQRIYTAGLLTVILVTSLPVLRTPRWPAAFGSVEPIDQITYEQQGFGIAVLPPGYSLPTTLPENAAPNRLLLSSYESGSINRVVPTQAVNRTQINLIAYESHRIRYQVTADTPSSVDLLTAYFPGWQTSAFDERVSLANDEQTGLMRLNIPSMSGEVAIALGPTAIRQTAWGISAAAFLVLLLIFLQRTRNFDEQEWMGVELNVLPVPEARLLSLIVVAFAFIILVFTSPVSPISLYDQPGHGLAETTQARYSTNVGLESLAHTIHNPVRHPGEMLELTLYWQALRTLPANYQVQISLVEADSEENVQRTQLRTPGQYPTSRWRTYLYVRDEYRIPLRTDLPAGDYRIGVEVFECSPECSNRVTFFNISGQNIGRKLILPTPVSIEA